MYKMIQYFILQISLVDRHLQWVKPIFKTW